MIAFITTKRESSFCLWREGLLPAQRPFLFCSHPEQSRRISCDNRLFLNHKATILLEDTLPLSAVTSAGLSAPFLRFVYRSRPYVSFGIFAPHFFIFLLTNPRAPVIIQKLSAIAGGIWGYSSAGRALEWHSRGQRFDPAYLHQKPSKSSDFGGFSYFTELKCRILPHFVELPDTYLTTNLTI